MRLASISSLRWGTISSPQLPATRCANKEESSTATSQGTYISNPGELCAEMHKPRRCATCCARASNWFVSSRATCCACKRHSRTPTSSWTRSCGQNIDPRLRFKKLKRVDCCPALRGSSPLGPATSLCFDPQFLDDRPPFLNIGLLLGAEAFRRLLGARKEIPKIGKPRMHRRIAQCFHGRRAEFADDVLRRAPGGEKTQPSGVVKRGSPTSAKVGMSGASVKRVSLVTA
jgi:hypothetical protein